jgi:hypothetical protein
MPDQFYYSTLQFEPETEQLRDRVRESLAADIKSNMAPGFAGVPSVGPWRFNAVMISDVQLRDKWLLARTYMLATALTLAPPQRFSATFDLYVSALPGLNTPIFKPGRDASGKLVVRSDHPIYYVRQAQMSDLVVHRDSGIGLPVQPSDLFPCRSYPGTNPMCIEALATGADPWLAFARRGRSPCALARARR